MKRARAPRRHGPRPNNDIEALAQKVPGFAAQHYVDEQESQAASTAATRWPRLAGWLGYGEVADDGSGKADREDGGPAGPAR